MTLDTENIRAKSVAMVNKELLTSMVAYNLVVQFCRQAAKLANVPPRRPSLAGVWNAFASSCYINRRAARRNGKSVSQRG